MNNPVVIPGSGTLVPDDRPYWTSPEMYNAKWGRPTFISIEVAHVFFGRSRTWFMHLMPLLQADDVGEIDMPRSEKHLRARRWRLWDIERFAHLLLIHGKISVDHFGLVLNVIKSTATMYGYDVGDERFKELWKTREDPVHAQAMALIDKQYAADPKTPTTGKTEQLADLAAWAIRRLENNLKGIDE